MLPLDKYSGELLKYCSARSVPYPVPVNETLYNNKKSKHVKNITYTI